MGNAQQLCTASPGHNLGSGCCHAGSVGFAAARVSTWPSTYTTELAEAKVRAYIL